MWHYLSLPSKKAEHNYIILLHIEGVNSSYFHSHLLLMSDLNASKLSWRTTAYSCSLYKLIIKSAQTQYLMSLTRSHSARTLFLLYLIISNDSQFIDKVCVCLAFLPSNNHTFVFSFLCYWSPLSFKCHPIRDFRIGVLCILKGFINRIIEGFSMDIVDFNFVDSLNS